MPLATCSRFLRPCLGRITPSLGFSRLSRCRLFHSLEKRKHFAANQLQTVRQASGSGKNSDTLSDNALLVVGIGFLGGSLAYVSMLWTLFCSKDAEFCSLLRSVRYEFSCTFVRFPVMRTVTVETPGVWNPSPLAPYIFFLDETHRKRCIETNNMDLISKSRTWCPMFIEENTLSFNHVKVEVYTNMCFVHESTILKFSPH